MAIVEQVASFTCLANNQVLDSETVEPYDDRSWPLARGRFWSKASMGSVQLRERAKHLCAKDIQAFEKRKRNILIFCRLLRPSRSAILVLRVSLSRCTLHITLSPAVGCGGQYRRHCLPKTIFVAHGQ